MNLEKTKIQIESTKSNVFWSTILQEGIIDVVDKSEDVAQFDEGVSVSEASVLDGVVHEESFLDFDGKAGEEGGASHKFERRFDAASLLPPRKSIVGELIKRYSSTNFTYTR